MKRANKKLNSTGRNAVIYARYSSHNQKDASIEQQIEACLKKARAENLNVVETYADRAISGKTDKRPQFQQMLRDAEQGKFQYVIAWKSNRMGRNMLQAMVNTEMLQECGINCVYVEEDFGDTAAGRFALRNMMSVNQFYIENMAEDIRRGMQDNAKQCKANGSPPYGYKISKDKHFEIDEEAAKVVREVYEQIAAGTRIINIARSLNERGIRTRRGYEWNKSSFNKMLGNERYRGVYIFNDIRIEGGMPRIVSDELYFKVQEAIRMKPNPRCMGRRTENGVYLLTGKLFCGRCLAPMRGESGHSKNGKLHFYYKCRNRRIKHSCNMKAVQRDYIENLVAKLIYENCLRDDIIELIAENTIAYNIRKLKESNVGTLEQELDDINRRIGNFLQAMEGGSTRTMKEHLAKLEDEQMRLNIKLNEAKVNIISCSKEQLVVGMRIFQKGNVEDKKFQADLFDTFLQAVYLYDDKIKLVFSFVGENNTLEIPTSEMLDNAALDVVYEEPADCSHKVSFAPPNCTVPHLQCQVW